MKLFIKYMVSHRCKMVVKEVLDRLALPVLNVDLGVVEIEGEISEEKLKQLKSQLHDLGFELLEDKHAVLIHKIKNAIMDKIYQSDEITKVNFSDYLSKTLNHDYTYLANLFKKEEGITIEQFVINHKVEQVKELLLSDEINITEIAYRMNYSSVAHLSAQFKKMTGLSPSGFKKLRTVKQPEVTSID